MDSIYYLSHMKHTLKSNNEIRRDLNADLNANLPTEVAGQRYLKQLEANGLILKRGFQGPLRAD